MNTVAVTLREANETRKRVSDLNVFLARHGHTVRAALVLRKDEESVKALEALNKIS